MDGGLCLGVSGDYIVWANQTNTSEGESQEEWYCYNIQQSQTVCILDESDYGYDCWLQDNDLYIHNESQVNKIDLQTKENKVLYPSTNDIEISGIYVYKENVILGIRNLQEETSGYYLLNAEETVEKLTDTVAGSGGVFCKNGLLYYCSDVKDNSAKVSVLDISNKTNTELKWIDIFTELVVTDSEIYYVARPSNTENGEIKSVTLKD